MKSKFFICLACITIIAACAKKETDAKREELNSLKKEYEAMGKKIKELESELGVEEPGFNKKAVLVTLENLKADTFNHYIEVHGVVEANQNVQVVPEFPGVIERIAVEQGQSVSQGQLIAVIHHDAVLKNIKALETDLEFANTVYNKQRSLWDQKIGSEIQYLEAKTRKESLEKRLAAQKEELAKAFVRSPINGVVDDIFPKAGEMASMQMPIARVVNVDKVYITANVSETYLEKFKKGQNVNLSFPTIDKELTGKISAVGQFINPNNRTFKVTIDVSNKNGNLKPNLLAVVKIRDYANTSVITVPTNVIQFDQNGNYVFTAEGTGENMIADKKYISIGKSYKGRTEVLEGLKNDEKAVVEGFRGLTDDDKIFIK
ncbi:MAG: efflux RND transporter periplasmic adaptor subunit [Cytophagaceae bacterium]